MITLRVRDRLALLYSSADIAGGDHVGELKVGPTGRGRGRSTMRWKAALNAFDIAFDGRLSTANL
jgi:hypothetical protein